MVFGVVLAGGSGSRMGADLPKQFIDLCSKPVICYSLDTFLKSEYIDKTVLVVPEAYLPLGKDISRKYFSSSVYVTAGGSDRNESLMNAIAFIEENFGADAETVVVTHDGARPFVSERMIKENVEAMREFNACDTCIESTDTVIEARDGVAVSMPERQFVFRCQTPQTFKALKLKEYYNSLSDRQKASLTDAGKIFFLKGEKVKIVAGDQNNIKITYPEDLTLAKSILEKE